MTIASADTVTSITGNGVTTAIPVPFVFFGEDELEVIERVIATGVEAAKALSIDYTVSGGNGDVGTVTANVAPPATVQWFVRRNTKRTQETDLTENDNLPAEALERALDRLAAIMQEFEEIVGRAVVFPVTDPASARSDLGSSVTRAGKYLAAGVDGKLVWTAGTTSIAVISAFAEQLLDDVSAAAMRATLGLGTAAPLDVGTTADKVVQLTAAAKLPAVDGSLLTNLPIRERLTAARTYYVRTDGSDANTGLANTAGGAFLTIQKAIDVVCDTIDNAGYDVTIQLGDGTYTGAAAFRRFVGRGAVTLQGNAGTPGNVVISTTSADAVRVEGAGIDVVVKDLELRTTTAGNCLAVSGPCRVSYSNVRFGACASAHLLADRTGYIRCTGSYAIVGAAVYHWHCTNGPGLIFITGGNTVTITGTPAFSGVFAATGNNASIVCGGLTFSGSATGTRYSATTNGVINTNGGGASYLPGNAVGSTGTGGQYV